MPETEFGTRGDRASARLQAFVDAHHGWHIDTDLRDVLAHRERLLEDRPRIVEARDRYKAERDALKSASDELHDENARLTAENQRLRATAELVDELSAQAREGDAAARDTAEARHRAERLAAKLAAANMRTAQLAAQLDALHNQVHIASSRINSQGPRAMSRMQAEAYVDAARILEVHIASVGLCLHYPDGDAT